MSKIILAILVFWVLMTPAEESTEYDPGLTKVSPTSPPPATNLLVIANGRIISGTGADPLMNGVVVIQNERILAVGRSVDLNLLARVRIIDVAGKTVLPGIINSHVHYGYNAATRHRFLIEGVTTICDLGSSIRYISEFDQSYTPQGQPAARGYRAGPMITITGGYPSVSCGYSWDYQISTPGEARTAVVNLLNQDVDVIKIALEPGHPKHPWPVLSREQAQAIVRTAHEHNVLVRAHVRQADVLDIALAVDVDVIEHTPLPFCLEAELQQKLDDGSLELANWPEFEAQLGRMAEQEIVLVPTLTVISHAINRLPRLKPEERRATLDFYLEIVHRFREMGGTVALGNDYGNLDVQPGMPLREMELLLAAGLTPHEVIEAGTRHAAWVCGHGDELGSLEPGKLADLIVVDGDPLVDIQAMSRVRLVIKGGEIVHLAEEMASNEEGLMLPISGSK